MRVSVVIPCYNAAPWVGATLRTLLNQTRPPDEIVLVDDGSSDGSAGIARGFGPAVRVIEVPNGGATRARLRGLAETQGEAVMFLDADDLMAPDTLGSLVAVLEDHPQAVAICPWMRYEWQEEGALWLAAPPSCAPRGAGQDDLSAWLTGWYHPPCSVLWSRAAYDRSGGWDPERAVNQDGDVMMRGLVAGNRLVCSATGTGFYRRLPGEALSLSGTARSRRGTAARLDVLDEIAARLAGQGRLSDYAAPLRQAYETVAAGAPPDLAGRAQEAVRTLPPEGTAPRESLLRHPGLRATPPAPPRPTDPGAEPAADAAPDTGADAGTEPGIDPAGARPAPGVDVAARPKAQGLPPADAGDRAGHEPRSAAAFPRAVPSPAPSEAPAVSVVIPVYNRPALVRRAVESVLAQDFHDLEVIVVDDASTDDTPAALQAIGDDRLAVLRQPRNRGVAAARNRGIAAARGAFVALLDSDDSWLPGKLSRQVALLRAAPPVVGMVYGGVEDVGRDGTRVMLPTARGFLFEQLLLENPLHGGCSNMLIRREVFETVGGFDPTYPAIEDYEFWLRACRFHAVDFVNAAVCRYSDAHDVAEGAQEGARRSRRLDDNLRGREMLHRRFAHDMRRAGVEHRFVLETARRMAAAGGTARLRAIRKVLGAARRRPTAWRLYGWLPLLMVPPALRDPLVAGLRRGRDRLMPARPHGKPG